MLQVAVVRSCDKQYQKLIGLSARRPRQKPARQQGPDAISSIERVRAADASQQLASVTPVM